MTDVHQPLCTVFTPAYNRAHLLPRLYASLCFQGDLDFEWLVVDDGSTDSTADVVRAWIDRSPFPVRLITQENGGKHRAINRAVRDARGELFAVLDSDDTAAPDWVASLRETWCGLPSDERPRYAGVCGLCRIQGDGPVLGARFPQDPWDASYVQMMAAGISGDKCHVPCTTVLRRNPFPCFEGERFVPEGLLWQRISGPLLFRHCNRVFVHKEYRADGLTASGLRIRVQSPLGTRLWYEEAFAQPLPPGLRLRLLVNALRFGVHAGLSRGELCHGRPWRVTRLLILPLVRLIAVHDRRRLMSHS